MSEAAKTRAFSEIKPFVLGVSGEDIGKGDSILAAGITLRGDIVADGDLTIAGSVQGTVKSSSRVLVSADGRVSGPITAAEIAVQGRVEGDLVATQRLTLHAGSSVRGDLETPTIVIEAGATLRGRCSMSSDAVA
jgi:cytoskeletal protein CcmA (bactofilin family)